MKLQLFHLTLLLSITINFCTSTESSQGDSTLPPEIFQDFPPVENLDLHPDSDLTAEGSTLFPELDLIEDVESGFLPDESDESDFLLGDLPPPLEESSLESPITTDIELQQEIDDTDGDDCPGTEACLTCCPLGYLRDIFGCFTCQCRKSGLFADDIIITENTYDDFFVNYAVLSPHDQGAKAEGRRSKRAANKQNHNTWPKQRGSQFVRIPYMFDFLVSQEVKRVLREIFEVFNQYTCIRFVPRSYNLDYIKFYDAGMFFCASHVGKVGGIQKLYLGKACKSRGVVAHEIMHALGFDHEQSRPDRDQYVKILWRNIRRGKRASFAKKDADVWNSYGTKYDLDSVMHYSSFQSSANGEVTMTDKSGGTIEKKTDFSVTDLIQINRMYNCPSYYENKVKMEMDKDFCTDKESDCETHKQEGWCTDSSKKEEMSEKCRKTCELCTKEHYTTQSTTTTTIKTMEQCKDTLSICPAWAKYNYCTDPRYMVYTRMKCKWSCGECDEVSTTTTTPKPTTTQPPTTAKTCSDKKKNCAYLARRGYCTIQKYRSHMKQNCIKTCKLCEGDVSTLKTKINNNLSNKSAPTPSPSVLCIDKSRNCAAWSKRGFCTNLRYRTYMKKSCRKSCSICQSAATKQSVTTTPQTTTNNNVLTTTKQSTSTITSTTKQQTTTAPTTTTEPLTTTTKQTTTAVTTTRHPEVTRKTSTTATTTTKRPTTRRSLTRKPGTKKVIMTTKGRTFCRDKLKVCTHYVQKNYCKRISSRKYMMVNCKKSCNFCK